MQRKRKAKKVKGKRYLFLLDYDGTSFDTLVDVEGAYFFALEQVFGSEGAEIFFREGGVRNRAPSEIVEDLLTHSGMIEKATEKFHETRDFLTDTIPCIVPLTWDEEHPEESITELVIRQKLRLLLGKITLDWPRPCRGIPELFEAVEELQTVDGVVIDIAILSAGHESFIRETFKIQGLKCPDLLATDDDFRRLKLTAEYRVKPAKALFDFAFNLWRKIVDGNGLCELDQVIYAGDCPIRDGGLALNAEVPFIFFNTQGQTAKYPFPLGSFQINDWSRVARYLRRPEIIRMMKLGKTTAEIFCPCQY